MSYSGRDVPPDSKQRAANSRSNGFGQSWWARQWVAALEAFGWDARLQRGRSYARAGAVQSAEVEPGRVTARVRGSRPRPYVVTISLEPLADAGWERVADVLAAEARYAATLLAGGMPPTIEQAFAEAGAHLFPHPSEAFETDCTCPDWANPCKHIAAVHYALASEFDRDPFLLFRLRGRTKEAVVAMLRTRRTRESSVAEPSVAPPPGSDDADLPLDAALEHFWEFGEPFTELRFSVQPPRVPGAVLKRLGSPIGSEAGAATLARLYRAISERAIESAYEGEGDRDTRVRESRSARPRRS